MPATRTPRPRWECASPAPPLKVSVLADWARTPGGPAAATQLCSAVLATPPAAQARPAGEARQADDTQLPATEDSKKPASPQASHRGRAPAPPSAQSRSLEWRYGASCTPAVPESRLQCSTGRFRAVGSFSTRPSRQRVPPPRLHSIYEQGLTLWRARTARCAIGAPVLDHVLTCQPPGFLQKQWRRASHRQSAPCHARPTLLTACGAARGVDTGDRHRPLSARHAVRTGTRTPNTKGRTRTQLTGPASPRPDTRALLQERWRRDRVATAPAGQPRAPCGGRLGEAGWRLGHSACTGQQNIENSTERLLGKTQLWIN